MLEERRSRVVRRVTDNGLRALLGQCESSQFLNLGILKLMYLLLAPLQTENTMAIVKW